jgi:hypothetical protein
MNKTALLFGICLLASLPVALFSQNNLEEYKEAPRDPYMPVDPAHRRTSPPFRFTGSNIFTVQVNVDANGNNIVGDAANEPSIAVDPNNLERMVIGWRQFDTIASDFRQAGFAYTNDAGQSWVFPGVIDPGVFRSDPVLDVDANGRFFYNSLTVDSDFSCNVFRSTGDGTWDEGPYAFGGDKQWMVIDKTESEGKGHIYSNWNADFTVCPPASFTRSTDGGDSYEACSLVQPWVQWGTLAVGPEGELYTVGISGQVGKSLTAKLEGLPVVWQSLQANLSGTLVGFAAGGPNPVGLLGQSWIATDVSGGANHGNVYVLASVQPTTVLDPLDVHFTRSTDGGLTWSNTQRINDDVSTTNWQWFGTMSVAPNGRIDAVWLDTRDNPNTLLSSLYFSFSEDGGLTWSANERLSEAFDPHLGWPQQEKLGDYFHMVSDNQGAHLAWAATFNGEQDVYYSFISPQPTVAQEKTTPEAALFQNFPNPFGSSTTISYQLEKPAKVQLKIAHQTGQILRTVEQGQQAPGNYTWQWDGKDALGQRLPAGLYTCELCLDGRPLAIQKMVMAR